MLFPPSTVRSLVRARDVQHYYKTSSNRSSVIINDACRYLDSDVPYSLHDPTYSICANTIRITAPRDEHDNPSLAPCFRIYLSADKKSPQKTVPSWVISLVIQSVIVAIHIVGAAPIYNRYLHLRGDGEVDLEGMEFASISWPWIITAIGIDFAAMVKITIVICGAIDSLSSASIDSIDASDIPSTDCLLSLKKSVPSQGGSIDSVQPDQLLWGRAINLAKMSREKRAELYTSYLTGLMGSGVVGIVGIMALLTAYAVQDVSAGSDDPESLDYPIDMYSSTLGHIAFVIMCALIAARNTLLTRLQDLLYRVYGDNSIHTDPSDVGFAGGCEMHWP
ncbi:hypothetical protein BASA60_011297 [Batrachochytrium salamandrivorans]|nr:hypothetical protein BASA60_011297 [Batrachochytrium salamandrivorans]